VSDDGDVVVSSRLSSDERRLLGLDAPLRVRRLEGAHRRYLLFHRENVFKEAASLVTKLDREARMAASSQ
jgi:hypothetical protein